MRNDSAVYVGLDLHKDSITVAYAIDAGEVELLGKIGTTKAENDRLCTRLQSKAPRVRVVYEAGPCSYGLYRQLVQKGFDCMVCEPSLIPRKPGERVKTDRRDAIKLVRSLRAGDLSAVYVPGIEDEAFRDLARRVGRCPRGSAARTAATEIVPARTWRSLYRQRKLGRGAPSLAGSLFVSQRLAAPCL
jgi:transposase